MMKAIGKGVLLGLLAVGTLGSLCEERKVTTQTEVKDRLLGGKEVKETQVIEQGDKTQIREEKTKTHADGTLDKKETEIKGDDIK